MLEYVGAVPLATYMWRVAMAKIPEIDGLKLNSMKGRIRLIARDTNGGLWYIHERSIDPRKTIFTRNPILKKPANDIRFLARLPIFLTLMPCAREVEATVAEIFAQLQHPIHPDGRDSIMLLGRIDALEVIQNEYKIDPANNAMIAYINLYQHVR